MNQSIAVLFKSRLFLGDLRKRASDEATPPVEKEDTAAKPSKSQEDAFADVETPEGLNCIKEESSAVSDEEVEQLQVPKQSRGGKFRTLKNRMTSLPDLHFKSTSSVESTSESRAEEASSEGSKSTRSRDSSNHHNLNRLREKTKSWFQHNNMEDQDSDTLLKAVPKINSVSDNMVCFDCEPIKKSGKRSMEKRLSMGSISRINTASSTGSSVRHRSYYARWSLVRSNSEVGASKRLSTFSQSSRNSMESSGDQGSMLTINPVVRRRSKTVGALDQEKKQKGGNYTQTSRVRSNSSLNNQYMTSPVTNTIPPSTSTSQLAIPFPAQPPASPRFSNSSSRRSNSIVNAISNFVSIKQSSFSSKGNPPKYLLALEFLPSPPKPLPEDSCEEYLMKLGDYGKFISVILSKEDDPFKTKCLNVFIENYFEFQDEPLDISLRKLLMFIELPKETQQIDRVLTEFSKVYYETNKVNSMWESADQVYFMTYSLLMLHTDAFNANNKSKMLKQDFVRLLRTDSESGGNLIPKELLEYFYDNITSREFSQVDLPLNVFGSEEATFDEGDNQPVDNQFHTPVPYSPKDIIKSGSLFSRPDISPLMMGGRSSSNPLVSYISLNATPNTSSPSSLSNISIRNDDIDIYFHIANDSLKSVMLQADVDYIWDDTFETTICDERSKIYNKYMAVIKETKGGYLCLEKTHAAAILQGNYDTIFPDDEESDYVYLKIIQMGQLEELFTNRKFSIVGSINRTSWRNFFGILTSCCLFVFNDGDWVDPTIITDAKTNTSNYILDCKPAVEIHMILGCNGLFATERSRMGQLVCPGSTPQSPHSNIDEPIMYLYSNNQKYTFKCCSEYEAKNWIDSINIIAAFDGCYVDMGAISHTISSLRKTSVHEKLKKLETNKSMKQEKLEYFSCLMDSVRHTLPITSKIRSNLMEYAIQLSKKMEWLLYEIRRNQIYMGIMLQLNDLSESQSSSARSSVEQSFIFNETLERCDTDCTTNHDHDHDTSFDMDELLNTF